MRDLKRLKIEMKILAINFYIFLKYWEFCEGLGINIGVTWRSVQYAIGYFQTFKQQQFIEYYWNRDYSFEFKLNRDS